MKKPKIVKRYCPYCKKHTEHKVTDVKTRGKRGTLKAGQRRHERRGGIKGYGGYPQPKMEKGKRYGAKTTKKTNLKYTCTVCKKSHIQRSGVRTKKLVIG